MFGQYQYPFNGNQQTGLARVDGINGAKSYPTYPGNTVALFDSGEDIMYIKSTDQFGFPSIRTFRFEEIKEQPEPSGDYVSRKELEEYVKQFIQQYTSESTTDTTA